MCLNESMRVPIVELLGQSSTKRDQAAALCSLCPELGRAGGSLTDHLPGEGLQLVVWPVIFSARVIGKNAEDLQEEVAQAVCCYSQVHGVQAVHHYVFHLEARC